MTSSGMIKSGQGNEIITVRKDNTCITVTVEVFGLPASCESTASEASCIDPPPVALLEEIFDGLNADNEQRIRAAAEKSSYYDQLFVIVTAKSSRTAERRIRRLKQILSKEIGRVTFVKSVSVTEKIKVYIVPPGATPPIP